MLTRLGTGYWPGYDVKALSGALVDITMILKGCICMCDSCRTTGPTRQIRTVLLLSSPTFGKTLCCLCYANLLTPLNGENKNIFYVKVSFCRCVLQIFHILPTFVKVIELHYTSENF